MIHPFTPIRCFRYQRQRCDVWTINSLSASPSLLKQRKTSLAHHHRKHRTKKLCSFRLQLTMSVAFLGMAMSVTQCNTSFQTEISKQLVDWLSWNLGQTFLIIYPPRINNFGDPLTFHLTPSSGQTSNLYSTSKTNDIPVSLSCTF